jgi:hypothetical protein
VSANNPLHDILAGPLGPDWTVDGLAEQVLDAIATQHSEAGEEFVLDAGSITDHQVLRLLRPLLACLANKSAAEAGAPINLYGGQLSFKQSGPEGFVWIVGQFENQPGNVRIALRRSGSLPEAAAAETGQEPQQDDGPIDELVASNPKFQALVAKSKTSPRKPFSLGEQ